MHLARVLRSSAQLQPGCLGVGPVSPVQLSWGLQGWRGQGVPRPHLAAGVIQSAEGAIGLGQISSDSHAPDLCGVADEGLLLLENQPPGQRRCPGQATGPQGAGVGCSGRENGGSWKLRASILGVVPSIHTRQHRASVWLHQGLRRSRQISNARASLSKHSHARHGQASVSLRLGKRAEFPERHGDFLFCPRRDYNVNYLP